MEEKDQFTLQEAHLNFAKSFNGKVWELLEKPERSPDEDQEMVMAAYASAYHWRFVGTPLNQQRGEWMLAHAYTVLGIPDLALEHAQTCFELTEANPTLMETFDLAYAAEGLARANALAGNQEEAKRRKYQARLIAEKIEGDEDKKIFIGDLMGGEWYGV